MQSANEWLVVVIAIWALWLFLTRRKSYSELLRDPHWSARKAQYYARYPKICVWCGGVRRIQLDHKYYQFGRAPWDYPDSALQALCSGCHARKHGR